MKDSGTLLLRRNDVQQLLTIGECMEAIKTVFAQHAAGSVAPPKVMGLHNDHGGIHIKAGMSNNLRNYFVTKINANFPQNPRQFRLPTIQGVIALFDAVNGCLLSLMDSIEITIIRTGAATGVAADYLARKNATIAIICGCGNQGRISLKAILQVRKLRKVYLFDTDPLQMERMANEFAAENLVIMTINRDQLSSALKRSHIVVTCTTSKKAFIMKEDIRPGTFIAAVGADSEEKQELEPQLLTANKIVADVAEQSASIGEFHHAIESGLAKISDIYAELGQIVAGIKEGRESEDEIIIFDSTGTALQDVASASIVYEKAVAKEIGFSMNFSNTVTKKRIS